MIGSGARPDDGPSASQRYGGRDYIIVNLVLWAVLLVLGLFTYFVIDKAPVVPFLVAVVGGGFSVVSVFDYFYDRISSRSDKLREGSS